MREIMAVNSIGWANKQESQVYAQNLLANVKNGNQDAIDSICSGIFDSTAGRLGTNETFVEEVINNADAEILTMIMDRYSEVTGSEIYKDIENDYSGKSERELIEKLENAYTSTKDEEYTGWNDGKLNNEQIAKNLHDIIYSKDWNRGQQLLKLLKENADPVNINLIIEEYKNLTGGRDLQEDANIVSCSINDYRINKLFDSLLHFKNLNTSINNKYWQGDSHNVVREGSVFTITNNKTNEMRQIDLVELLKNFKTSEERNKFVKKLQEMPAEVLMDIAAEQQSFICLNGKTVVSTENGAGCNAAGYYSSGTDQVAVHIQGLYSMGFIDTLVHEMGHALDYNKQNGNNNSSATNNEYYLQIFNEEMEEYLAAGNKRYVYGEFHLTNSTYATANEREMFAECYALLMTGDCSSKKVIEKYFPRMLSYVKQLIEHNRSLSDSVRH